LAQGKLSCCTEASEHMVGAARIVGEIGLHLKVARPESMIGSYLGRGDDLLVTKKW